MVKRNLQAKKKTTSLKSLLKNSSESVRSKKSRIRSSMRRTFKKTKSWEDVHPEKNFWVNDGKILKNLKELPGALRNMSNETFLHHVNEHKNDFANWVEEVVGEKKLAAELRPLQSRTSIMKAVKSKL